MNHRNFELTDDALNTFDDGQISDDQLDLVSGGIGNVIASTYKRGDGNGEAAFYAGVCMGLLGF